MAAVIGYLANWISAHLFVARLIDSLPSFWQPLLPAAMALACGLLAWLTVPNALVGAGVAFAAYAFCAALVGGRLMADVKRLACAKANLAVEPQS